MTDYLSILEDALSKNPSDAVLRKELSEIYLVTGHTLFDQLWNTDNPADLDLPLHYYHKALSIECPELEVQYIEGIYRMAFCVHFQSKNQEALNYIREALRRLEVCAEKEPLGREGIRFLQHRSGTLTNIGHLANEPELFTKMGMLGLRPPYRGVLLGSYKEIVNQTLLNYWRRSIIAITDESLIRRMRPLSHKLEYNTFWTTMPKGDPAGDVLFQWPAMNVVNGRWEKAGRGPLLTLTEFDKSRGWAMLESLGVPKDAWFVALHVRDQRKGKLGKPIKASTTKNRDAKIETYYDAIRVITDAGGWVIRLGDISMPPLPEMTRVIDYPHTKAKAEWMDIFLVAASKFFLCTASGLYGVASNFGVPCIMSNASPVNSWPLSKNDIHLPKLLKRKQTGEFVPFREMLREPFSYCYSGAVYDQAGVEIIDNTPEEITEATIEMMTRIGGTWTSPSGDEERQRRFRDLVVEVEPYGIQCSVGSSFLAKYEALLK